MCLFQPKETQVDHPPHHHQYCMYHFSLRRNKTVKKLVIIINMKQTTPQEEDSHEKFLQANNTLYSFMNSSCKCEMKPESSSVLRFTLHCTPTTHATRIRISC